MAPQLLELEQVLPAPAQIVFAAFADPDEVAAWFGPHGYTAHPLAWDPRPGSGYRLEMHPPEGDAFHVFGEFRDIDPPVRLAFTFAYEPPDPDDVETVVTLTFFDHGDSTRVELTQGPFQTEDRLELHRVGWGDSFDRLAEVLR